MAIWRLITEAASMEDPIGAAWDAQVLGIAQNFWAGERYVDFDVCSARDQYAGFLLFVAEVLRAR